MVKRVPGGPVRVPLLGNSLRYADDPLDFMERCARRYGSFVRIEAYGRELYQLTDPEGIKRVLVENDRNYRKPDFGGEGLDGLLGQGLLTSEGETWREERQRLQPAFYREPLARYGETVVREAAALGDTWRDGERRDVSADMSTLALRIIVETVLGAELHGMERAVTDALVDVGEFFRSDTLLSAVPRRVPTPRNVRYGQAVETLDRVVADLVRQRRRSESTGDDVLGLLLRAQEIGTLSDERIRDEVLTMLLAGHDTTALTLTYVWYLLAGYPDVERRFHAELDAGSDGEPTPADARELTYTERIIQEAMRLYPPAYVVYRESVEIDEVAGFHVPAGALISMPQWVVHRDPEYWVEPTAFRPSRWDEPDPARPEYAYFPFGGGSRRCIGDRFARLEATLALATLGRRFRLERTSDDLDLAPMVTLHPDEPVEMRVVER